MSVVLGIETSCDETAAAVVRMNAGGKLDLLSNVLVSQVDIHSEFGGVVPEVAARNHIEVMLPIVDKALRKAFLQGQALQKGGALWDKIDAVAVTYGPGLSGSLLVGTLTARTLALLKNKPLYAINHVEGHVYANWLLKATPRFPLLALIVSGGHTQLVLFKDHFDYRLLGQTRDDAAGEAFDKVAKMLGLSYPGGPAIALAAQAGDPRRYNFPTAQLEGAYDFSFSGLKTAVLRHLQRLVGRDYSFPSFKLAPLLSQQQVADTAASFQRVAVATLVAKTAAAYREFSPETVVIAGGVAANQALRRKLQRTLPLTINYAPPLLCTDNAAMIAALGCFNVQGKKAADPLVLEVEPGLTM